MTPGTTTEAMANELASCPEKYEEIQKMLKEGDERDIWSAWNNVSHLRTLAIQCESEDKKDLCIAVCGPFLAIPGYTCKKLFNRP